MYVKPNPPSSPVTSLLILVDSHIFKYWIPQSIPIGTSNNMEYIHFILTKNMQIIAAISPIKTPVQRAHIGNWYPFRKKLLSDNIIMETNETQKEQNKKATKLYKFTDKVSTISFYK